MYIWLSLHGNFVYSEHCTLQVKVKVKVQFKGSRVFFMHSALIIGYILCTQYPQLFGNYTLFSLNIKIMGKKSAQM